MSVIDVVSLIDERPIGRLQIRMVVLCFSVLVIDGFDAQAIGYLAPSLAKSLRLQPASLTPIFGAGLLGMALGSLLLGLLADRFGRKIPLVMSLAWFGVFTIGKSVAASWETLLVFQFLAGLGLGGAYPNAIAIISEYSPARLRHTMVTVSACGYLFGSSFGGFLAAFLIPRYGWPSVFQFGGVVPILIAAVLVIWLPDSIRHLVLHGAPRLQIERLLRRMAPGLPVTPETRFVVPEARPKGFPVVELFREGRAFTTSLIWVTQFMTLLVAFFIFSWLPLIFNSAGLAAQQSMLAATALPLGAMMGTVFWGRLIDKLPGPPVLGCAALIYALFLAPLGSATQSFALLVALLFLAGIGSGSQSAFNSFTASAYPTLIRSTGLGWAIGVGRVGSMLGPFFGGAMISRHWSLPSMFYAATVPVLIAALSLFLLGGRPSTDAARNAGRLAPPDPQESTVRNQRQTDH